MSTILFRLQHARLFKASASQCARPNVSARSHFRRQFHASPPNQLVDQILHLTHDYAFQAIHSYSGLPWGLSIPLTAVGFRLLLNPILQYPADRARMREQIYAPLISAWASVLRKRIVEEKSRDRTSDSEVDVQAAQVLIVTQLEEKQRFYAKKYKFTLGLQYLPVGFLPIWLLNLEVLRRMCGQEHTLFGLLRGTGDQVDPRVIPMEPTLQAEGILWFQDLTAPDPTWLLPLALWAFAGLKLYTAPERPTLADIEHVTSPMVRSKARFYIFLRDLLLYWTVILGPSIIYFEIPSALVLYWLTGMVYMEAERTVMRRLMGYQKAIQRAEPKMARLRKTPRKVTKSALPESSKTASTLNERRTR